MSGEVGDHRFRKKPKGATGGGYTRPRVQVGFDRTMLAKITALAKKHNISFAAQVRELCRRSLRGTK